MISDTYLGKIFNLSYPSNNFDNVKLRPALAISEPDDYGDVRFVFITTKHTCMAGDLLDLPENLLPYSSHIHLNKIFLLHKSVIQKELASVDYDLLEQVLRKITLIDSRQHYLSTQALIQAVSFKSGISKLNYAGRVYDENEVMNLVDSSLDFWLTGGRYVAKFEKEFAEFMGVKHCSLTNSGSSANLLAFMALTSPSLGKRQIKKGDEVITVAVAFPTTIAPIIQYGAIPVFVDIDLCTYNIDCSQLEQALSKKTKAVLLAHTLGNPFDLRKVKRFCDRHKLWLIEDNCDALGSRYKFNGKWRQTGTIGDLGTSSFYPPHHITMGEGGAVYTDDVELKRLVESFRDWGRDCWCDSGRDNSCKRRFSQRFGELPYGYDHKYVYSHFGYNLKLTEMQAAIGCAQLEKLPDFIAKRKENWQQLKDGLASLEKKLILPEAAPDSDPSWFGFLLTVREEAGFSREQIISYLEAKKIQTRVLFAGNLIKHPCFNEMRVENRGYRVVGSLGNTDRIMNNTFWVGVYPGMTSTMICFMIDEIVKFVKSSSCLN